MRSLKGVNPLRRLVQGGGEGFPLWVGGGCLAAAYWAAASRRSSGPSVIRFPLAARTDVRAGGGGGESGPAAARMRAWARFPLVRSSLFMRRCCARVCLFWNVRAMHRYAVLMSLRTRCRRASQLGAGSRQVCSSAVGAALCQPPWADVLAEGAGLGGLGGAPPVCWLRTVGGLPRRMQARTPRSATTTLCACQGSLGGWNAPS